jgi:hypothetical protein
VVVAPDDVAADHAALFPVAGVVGAVGCEVAQGGEWGFGAVQPLAVEQDIDEFDVFVAAQFPSLGSHEVQGLEFVHADDHLRVPGTGFRLPIGESMEVKDAGLFLLVAGVIAGLPGFDGLERLGKETFSLRNTRRRLSWETLPSSPGKRPVLAGFRWKTAVRNRWGGRGPSDRVVGR